ncbi:MAG: hypothetical protein ACRD6B_11105, partial [Bryobacteraceae bacterium]
ACLTPTGKCNTKMLIPAGGQVLPVTTARSMAADCDRMPGAYASGSASRLKAQNDGFINSSPL